MMTSSKELTNNVDNIIEVKEKKVKFMCVIEFDKQSIIFLVEESINPRQRCLPGKLILNISKW